MAFQSASNFLFMATAKLNLEKEAKACLICEKTRQYLAEYYPEQINDWKPKKFVEGVLTILATNSSAHSSLYLMSSKLVLEFEELNLPQKIHEIRVAKA